MKLLLDTCVWGGAKGELSRSGIIRLVNISATRQGKACLEILEKFGK